jgi:hypothetical protein
MLANRLICALCAFCGLCYNPASNVGALYQFVYEWRL